MVKIAHYMSAYANYIKITGDIIQTQTKQTKKSWCILKKREEVK